MRLALEPAGYEVYELETALDAVKAILRRAPDLVLMDVAMPDLAGDEAVRVVRASHVGLRVCVLLFSEKSEEELKALAAACGADGYIQKTSDDTAFLKNVEQWFEKCRVASSLLAK